MIIGAHAIEQDYSHYVAQAAKTVLAVVGTASKGPIGKATVCTSTQDLANKFGNLRTDCPALYAGQYFLSQSSKLYFIRAASITAAASKALLVGGEGSSVTDALTIEMLDKGDYYNGYILNVTVPEAYRFKIIDDEGKIVDAINKVSIDTIKRQSAGTAFDLAVATTTSGTTTSKVSIKNITPGEYELKGTGSLVATVKGDIYDASGSTKNDTALTVTYKLSDGAEADTYRLLVEKAYYDIELVSSTGAVIEKISKVDLEELTKKSSEGKYLYTSSYLKVVGSNDTALNITPGKYTLKGGNSGIEDITAADYISAANALLSDTLDINLIAVPGQSDYSIVNSVLTIASNRGDCLYLVDAPEGLTRDGIKNWRNGEGYEHPAFDSSYGALYYDWTTIYDSVNKVKVVVPPSVTVAATYAYSDRVSEFWYAPAGLNRGIIRGALDTVTPLNKTDVQILYDEGINSMYNDPQVGLVVWGQKTLSLTNTALDRVNVRRLMNYLKRVVTAACNYLTFDMNDRITWNNFRMKVDPILKNIQEKRGVYEYRIISGSSIVTDNDIDNYRMPGMILIRPTKAAEEIPIYFTLSNTGADFNEVIDSSGVVVHE